MYIYVIKTPKYIIETGRYILFIFIKSSATMNTIFVYFNLLSSGYKYKVPVQG